eukprot:CAMPEP_0119104886 /NCGR_PEP_ID=MMETSP1180-20130426/2975_1 /TAXON_ID=3052 ORGANISM="Chlamydomonas cf sp, Strain CCMP681" /NCGR_SAMPLE_ID=MMETSP1180 /ASSEMBLY_ACC=CAM_ASM_000741 /LENGTH=92 /DNA_ID=CAMNT_0007089751 /DNA_START=411 /DNA_END=689 /DNA_ORIENTATION=-
MAAKGNHSRMLAQLRSIAAGKEPGNNDDAQFKQTMEWLGVYMNTPSSWAALHPYLYVRGKNITEADADTYCRSVSGTAEDLPALYMPAAVQE